MIAEVTSELLPINFAPKTKLEEILQNVRTILTTLKKTVPMDREFGISGDVIDLPIATAQAKLTAEIVAAIQKYERRANVLSVDYEGKEEDGSMQVKVRIEISNET